MKKEKPIATWEPVSTPEYLRVTDLAALRLALFFKATCDGVPSFDGPRATLEDCQLFVEEKIREILKRQDINSEIGGLIPGLFIRRIDEDSRFGDGEGSVEMFVHIGYFAIRKAQR
jgi:hypothetical protein